MRRLIEDLVRDELWALLEPLLNLSGEGGGDRGSRHGPPAAQRSPRLRVGQPLMPRASSVTNARRSR
jgi:hypothetical protein